MMTIKNGRLLMTNHLGQSNLWKSNN
jgi:hypothetical protein